jgi:kynureninase
MSGIDREYALQLDREDRLAPFRELFINDNPEICYLDGNSLGRLPKSTLTAINDFLLNEWGKEVVTGWGHWIDEAEVTGDLIGKSALGAGPGQVLACDSTSVNFYQLCMAAIKARPGRKTIITDAANFPTDRYILEGISKSLGMKLIYLENEIDPSFKNERITAENLEPYLNDDVALVSLEVIQYRSGARNDLKSITEVVRKYGGLVVWDASHAVGAIELNFDKSGVDLAVGCTYKYGNSGPGSPAWLYVRKELQSQLQVPIQGWFAQGDQFAMGAEFEKADGIRGFQIASPAIIGLRSINEAFAMIGEAGISAIAAKAAMGTELMIDLYDAWLAPLGFTLLTSRNAQERGGHLSFHHPEAERISVALRKFANVIPDYRTPNALRLAISPLPTSFLEVWEGFARIRDSVAARDYEKISGSDSRVT